jgi:hypothetical protein
MYERPIVQTDSVYCSSIFWMIESVKKGIIRIPCFKRPFEWSPDTQLELLRSIRDGLPIGSFLIWRSRTHELPSYDHIGTYKLEKQDLGQEYLLDGSKRITTLFEALNFEGVPSPAEAPIRCYLDAETGDFRWGLGPDDPDRYITTSSFTKTIELLRYHRRVNNQNWRETVVVVADAFNRYGVPVVPMATEDLKIVNRVARFCGNLNKMES